MLFSYELRLLRSFDDKNGFEDKNLNFIGMPILMRPNVKFIPDYRSSILTVMHVFYSFNETTWLENNWILLNHQI